MSSKHDFSDKTSEQLNFAEGGFDREVELAEVRDQICLAAAKLSRLGPDHARVAWMLEDILSYIEEAESNHEVIRSHPDTTLPLEDQVKIINSKSR